MKYSKKLICYLSIFAISCFNLISTSAQAKEIKLIFFYPGGEGSEVQAQPVLDEFSTALKEASNGAFEAQVRYFSDLSAGSTYITNQKPAGGILAYDLFLSQGPQWQAKTILQTLQLPSGDGKNQYFLIGNKQNQIPESGKLNILSSRPLSADFVKQELFPTSTLQWNVTPTKNIVGKLRRLGIEGALAENTWILLNQFEWYNISRLRTGWAANLKVFLESEKIPSAPFVIFDEALSANETQELRQALSKLNRNSKAKKTLELLRLKGFTP